MIELIIAELQKIKNIFNAIKEAINAKNITSSGSPSQFANEIRNIQTGNGTPKITRTSPETSIIIINKKTNKTIYKEGPQT